MGEGQDHAWLIADRPQSIGFGNRAGGMDRFADDPVDQRVHPQTGGAEPVDERGLQPQLLREIEHCRAQGLAVAGNQLARQERNPRPAEPPAAVEQRKQNRGETAG